MDSSGTDDIPLPRGVGMLEGAGVPPGGTLQFALRTAAPVPSPASRARTYPKGRPAPSICSAPASADRA